MNDIMTLPAILKIVSDAENALSKLAGYRIKVNLSVEAHEVTESVIQALVCEYFGVSWQDIQGGRGKQHVSTARQVYCYLITIWMHRGPVYIGRQINKDRTTVSAAVETIKDYLEVKQVDITNAITHIENKLTNAHIPV